MKPTLLFVSTAAVYCGLAYGQQPRPSEPGPAVVKRFSEAYGRLPIRFEPNRGQAGKDVKFLSYGAGYGLSLTSTEAVMKLSTHTIHMKLAGANSQARVTGFGELPGKTNYLVGKDSTRWRRNLPGYGSVKYEGVYPGTDLVYYGNQGKLEYDFRVSPGSDSGRIKLDFKGADKLRIDRDGNLEVLAGGEKVQEFSKPVIYQEAGGKRLEVAGSFLIRGEREVSFKIGGYDRTRELVIDPTIQYSTGIAGGLSNVSGIAVDASGYAYVTGTVYSGSVDMTENPIPDPNQTFETNQVNGFVAKLTPAGNALVYSTIVGGAGENPTSIAIDLLGNAYVVGLGGGSGEFPLVNAIGDYNEPVRGYSGTLLKLDPTGSRILFSTLTGGPGSVATDIAVDSAGIAYVAGRAGAFIGTPSAFQQNNPAYINVFVAKIDAKKSGLAALLYYTHLGGNTFGRITGGVSDYKGIAIAADNFGRVWVAGGTDDAAFPVRNAVQTSYVGGAQDAFVTCLDTNLSGDASLIYSTYLGGSGSEGANGVAVDSLGNAYVTGVTNSSDFPLMNPAQGTYNGGSSDGFVTKLSPTGAIVYSTYVGGQNADVPYDIAVDPQGNAYITGQTVTADTTVNIGPPLPANGIYAVYNIFVSKLNPAGNRLVYSVFIAPTPGWAAFDKGYSIAADSSGCAYVGGFTSAPSYPFVNPIQGYPFGNGGSAVVTKVCDGGLPTPAPPVITTPGNITANATGLNGAVVTYLASASDVVDGAVPVTCVPPSGSLFPIGTTTVVCTAIDKAGNKATASFTVTINGNVTSTPPTFTAPANQTLTATSAVGAVATYTTPVATDVKDGTAPVTCVPASGSTFPIGTTTVKCTATNKAGLTTTASFTVTVNDTPPAFTVPGNQTGVATSPAGALATYATPTATDLKDGADPVTCVPASGSTFPIGMTTVTCKSTNSSNMVTTHTFTVTIAPEPVTLQYAGAAAIANGTTATLSAVLLGGGVTPVAGRTVSLTLGSGSTAQNCIAITDTAGLASCIIPTTSQLLGQGVVTASFTGDAVYQAGSVAASTLIFAFAGGTGSFVLGDLSSSVGTAVTFWGAQWPNDNVLSGGSAPSSFKGYEEQNSTNPPTCGGTWISDPGNSSGPPASIPSYMGVIVSSSIAQSGSTLTGNIPKIVIVQTNSGYDNNPGHAGTGKVVAVLCGK